MKKALFLAYYYPPYGGGGVQRTTKYVKYLREQGWEPVVITIREDKIPLRDESLLKDVPSHLEIHRTDIWGLTFIEKLLKRRAASAKKRGQEAKEGAKTVTQALDVMDQTLEKGTAQGTLAKLKARLRPILRNAFLLVYSFILYPDDKIGWYPFAYRHAKERMSHGDIDLIYTTSAPFTAHLVGLRLKKLTSKPWVMDLRDPWAGNKYLLFSELRRPLDRMVEGWCVRKADQVVTVSEPLREDLLRSYPQEPQEKFVVISNGYDEDDLQVEVPKDTSEETGKTRGIKEIGEIKGIKEIRDHAEPNELDASKEIVATRDNFKTPGRKKPLTFSYTGSFYNEISPRYFLAAMDELLRKGSLPKDEVQLQLAGQFGAESLQLITAFQTAHPEVISISGYVPHSESTRRLLMADVQLLFLNKGAGRGVLTGKLFEYLGTRKPILAMIPEGLAAELIQEAGAGLVVPPEEEMEIQAALMAFYTKWKAGTLVSTTNPEVARRYSRKVLAGRLADLFNKLS